MRTYCEDIGKRVGKSPVTHTHHDGLYPIGSLADQLGMERALGPSRDAADICPYVDLVMGELRPCAVC